MTVIARSVVLCGAFLAITVQAFADINPGEISKVQIGYIQPTQVTFRWVTAHPSSSWVYLNFWNPGGMMPGRKVGQNDSVTLHQVTITGLVPFNPRAGNKDVGNYAFYIASQRTDNGTWASFGGPDTNAYNKIPSFHTTELSSSAPLSVAVVPMGQKHVYPGHDLYMMPTISLLSGGAGAQTGKIAVLTSAHVKDKGDSATTWRVNLLNSLRSYPGGFNPGAKWDGRILVLDSGPEAHKEYVWGPAQADWATAAQMNGDKGAIRVRIPSQAAPGDYTLYARLQMYSDGGGAVPVGSPIEVTWPFTVYPKASFTATPPSSYPPIPALSTWQKTMTSSSTGGGQYWCSSVSAAIPVTSLEYGAFLGPLFALVGNFNANSQPDASKSYNYDGGRVYMGIADYTYNTPGMPGYHDPAQKAYWEHCAQMVLYPFDNWITRSLGILINEPNQHLIGTGMYYARTGDPTAKSALSYVTGTHGPYAGYYGTLDTRDLRWISYTWDSQIANEASGARGPWELSGAATDVAMANLDMFQQFAVNQGSSVQPEWNYHNYVLGLLMEALIDQCELDEEKKRGCDPRIPLEIGKSLSTLFNNFYNSDIATTRYSLLEVPMSHTWNDANSTDIWANLNNLIDPAAAWYWAKTGDETIRGYGDAMFASTWKDTGDLGWGAKQFNQVFKWSFDFVRYRSGPDPKATFLPSQNPRGEPWPDTSPPLIFSEANCGFGNAALCQNPALPAPNVSGNTVTLVWDTIEPATTEVYYQASGPKGCKYKAGEYQRSVAGCVGGYKEHYSAGPGGERHHRAVITGLSPNTTYHYTPYSQDSAGNGAKMPDSTFTTGGASPANPTGNPQ
jgi:hypothetical protein